MQELVPAGRHGGVFWGAWRWCSRNSAEVWLPTGQRWAAVTSRCAHQHSKVSSRDSGTRHTAAQIFFLRGQNYSKFTKKVLLSFRGGL
jgi:hypothetical protein